MNGSVSYNLKLLAIAGCDTALSSSGRLLDNCVEDGHDVLGSLTATGPWKARATFVY